MKRDKARILIVEDEEAIRTGLTDVLVYHGYDVDAVESGTNGLEQAMKGIYDLVLLDVMLPGIDGFSICEKIREQDREQAIIMLTAKNTDEDVIQGLRLGADDYVSKPFSIAQLVLRIQAVLRRVNNSLQDCRQIKFGSKDRLDIDNMSGEFNGEAVVFTRREVDLLVYLYQHRNRPVSRDELLNKIWGYARNADLETRTVDIHIAKIRRKIERVLSAPAYLITVRGAGYRLMVE